MRQSTQSAGRRLSTITIDQILAGASNFLIAILAARVLGVESFGLFGIVFIVYATGQGVSRALICEPLLVHPVEAEERPGEVIGSAVVLGLGVGVIVCLSGLLAWVWDGRLGSALLIMGACMPLLVLQDLGRYLGFAIHRPSFSVVLDSVWLVLMVAAVSALAMTDTRTLNWFIAAWAGSGAVTGLLLLWQYRGHPLRPSLSWIRETWMFSWRYLISFMASQGSALVASIGMVAIAGVRTLGAVRGALLLLRPIGLFQAASVAAGVAEVSRIESGSEAIRRHVYRTTVLTVFVAILNMVLLLLLPDAIGRSVLGATWEPTKPLLLPASVQMVLMAVISGPRSALIGMKKVSTTLRIDIASTIMIVIATLAGAVVDGAVGAFWALSIAQGIIAVIWWVLYRSHHLEAGQTDTVEAEQSAVLPPAKPTAP